MKAVGTGMWILGLGLFAWACFGFDPSVATNTTDETLSRAVNIGRQQQQMLMALAGLSAFVTGALVHAIGIISDRLVISGAPSAMQTYVTPPAAIVPTEPDEVLMERHGITRAGEQFAYAGYRYDRLADAIAYARRPA